MREGKYLLEIKDISQIHKDMFETERLQIKMFLIAGNELNKEKWISEEAQKASNYISFPYSKLLTVRGNFHEFLAMEPDKRYGNSVNDIIDV